MSMKSVPERKIEQAEERQLFYTVESMERVKFTISDAAFRQGKTFVALLENLDQVLFAENPIYLETISTRTLQLVVEWIEHHKNDGPAYMLETRQYRNLVIPEWDDMFLKKLNNDEQCDVLCAANYLDIQRLMDYGCKAIANMARGKSVEELKIMFGYKSEEEIAEEALYEPGPSSR